MKKITEKDILKDHEEILKSSIELSNILINQSYLYGGISGLKKFLVGMCSLGLDISKYAEIKKLSIKELDVNVINN